MDPFLWRALNPQETIEESKPLQATSVYSLAPQELSDQMESLKQDGYCYIPSLIDPKKTERMLACVQLMVNNRFPPVYCFVYDLFWQLVLDLDPILKAFLQGDYCIIPNAWAWVVDGKKTTAYFPPHRDLIDEDFIDEQGMPTLFSLWIPLTDVSTHHSCMYLLPASKDPEYPHGVSGWREKGALRSWKAEELVHIRALPAPKGSLMGWNAGVFHWGSEPHPKASERISIGYYFHAPHAKKKYPGLIDLAKPLSFPARMGVIFDSLRLYGKSLGAKESF
jgi:hypothetical protein